MFPLKSGNRLFALAKATIVLPKILVKAILAFAKVEASLFIMPKILAKDLLALAEIQAFLIFCPKF